MNKEENSNGAAVGSTELLGLGLYVIETRRRNRNKNLGPWEPSVAFVDQCNAEQYLSQYAGYGYFRIVMPNATADLPAVAGKVRRDVLWPNGCERTAPAALRYLAEHDRPCGGEQIYNAQHLYQLAEELESAFIATQNAANEPRSEAE
jgi:hypothetical protein